MKITQLKLLAVALAITVVAGGALLLLPDLSHAVVACPGSGDTDSDGFTDAEECNLSGILGVLPCVGGEDRNSCLDLNSKDVFVILVPDNASLLPAAPLDILKGTGITGTKLGIAIHGISDAAAPNRVVTAAQKAIRILESLDTSDVSTGNCIQGNPNGLDGCVVFTKRIADFVNGKCPSGTQCLISGSATDSVATVISTYIKNTIAHEASHSMALAPKYDNRYGGNHYKLGTNVVMDQSVSYTTGSNKATFKLPGVYATADPAAAKLK